MSFKFRCISRAVTVPSLRGVSLWSGRLAACTRPDLAYSVSVLARFVSNPALEHFKAMQRVLVYLQCTADQLADIQTKALPRITFSRLVDMIVGVGSVDNLRRRLGSRRG